MPDREQAPGLADPPSEDTGQEALDPEVTGADAEPPRDPAVLPATPTPPDGAAPSAPRSPAPRSPAPGRAYRVGAIAAVVVVAAVSGWGVRYWFWGRPLDTAAYAPVVAGLERVGHSGEAAEARTVCRRAPACRCVEVAGGRALDADLAPETLTLVEAARDRCGDRVGGMEAEALARAHQLDRATARANEVLDAHAQDPNALYALAHVEYVRGNAPKAVEIARRSLAAGRTRASHLLLGLIAFYDADYEAANAAFGAILQADPDDVEALYDQALVAHASNRYREAREGYLRVLRLRLDHLDARYNLGLLLANSGVGAEAQHQLVKLRELAPPGDDRVTRLDQAIRVAALARQPAPVPSPPPASVSAAAAPPPLPATARP